MQYVCIISAYDTECPVVYWGRGGDLRGTLGPMFICTLSKKKKKVKNNKKIKKFVIRTKQTNLVDFCSLLHTY